MQFIRDIYAARAAGARPVVSFEFFAPKTDEGDRNLLQKTVPALLSLDPAYCSVTYGAGGSTRDKTLTIVDRIQREHRLTAMAHLTCVAHTQDQVAAVLAQARTLGIHNILALRGDPLGGDDRAVTEYGIDYASKQCEALLREGVPGIHFYTLNKPYSTTRIVQNLGLALARTAAAGSET